MLNSHGDPLDFPSFIRKFKVVCYYKDFEKVCKAIPLALIQLIKNVIRYSKVTFSLPTLNVNECNLVDSKCNNKIINDGMRQKIYFDYNRESFKKYPTANCKTMTFAHSKFVKWPISPKVKETHFKIINKIYPVSMLLERRFKFVADPCVFCKSAVESLEHLFFSCQHSQSFWTDIGN